MGRTKIFDSWTWNRKLPVPYDDSSIGITSTVYFSKWNTTSNPKSTLHSATLSAILKFLELDTNENEKADSALGVQGNNYSISEYKSHTGDLQAVVFNSVTGKFTAGCFDDLSQAPKPYVLKENKCSGTALIFSLMNEAMKDEEFSFTYAELLNEKKRGFSDFDVISKCGYILCDNIYRRIENADNLGENGIKIVIPQSGNIPVFTSLNLNKGTYRPNAVLLGEFKILEPDYKSLPKKSKEIDHSDFTGKYKFSKKEFTAEEKELIPNLSDWYVIPKEIEAVCCHAKETSGSNHEMRNFLLRGNAGTGKTEGAKAVANGLGLPYVHLTCSANTEIFDILGQMMPVTESSKIRGEYPTFEDIRMDPSTAYFKLTGEYCEEISENDVYNKLLEVIAENTRAEKEDNNTQKFQYVESPLIKAMKYGYLCEIQEPTVISNPGVLVGLNSLLDGCGSIVLPTGEKIKRHKDTVIVITTNIDYEGCKNMNQSIISRMDLVVDMKEPDKETLISRVGKITSCTDKAKLEQMADIVLSIQERCRMNMIDDGSCGVREFINWVQSYMVCGDILEAAKYTILSSVSSDEENREDIYSTCIEPIIGI